MYCLKIQSQSEHLCHVCIYSIVILNSNKCSSLRSVSLMSNPSFKTMRIIKGRLCSIINNDFKLDKYNRPKEFFPKTYNRKSCDTSQNFSRGPTKFLAWSECLWQKKNSTICLRTSVPYLSCQCCFPWVVADPEEIWFWNGKQTTLARKPESKNFVTQASVIHHQNRIGSSFSGVCDFK